MTNLTKLNTVETTRDADGTDGYTYRFVTNSNGTYIKRVASDNKTWSHDILVQVFDNELAHFVPVMYADLKYFKTLKAAMKVVAEY
jgi:hypothetical protein